MARLKLNKEEISTIESLQQRNNDLLFQIGDVEAGLRNLTKRKTELFEQWDELMSDDKAFGDTITEKYGKGTIDFQKNEIITED